MSFNKSPLAFDDIREAFEKALNAPKGVRVPCPTRGEAMVLRARFNYFRKLNRQENGTVYQPDHPLYRKSVFDKLSLRIPPKGHPEENILYIEPYSANQITIEEIEA